MTTTISDPNVVRSDALIASGFGQRFRLYQPRNLAFWVYLLLVVVGTTVMLQEFQAPLLAYQGSLAVSLLVFPIYAIPFWLFIRHIDRFDSVPDSLAVAAFAYGALAATGALVLHANIAVLALWAKLVGQEFAAGWSPALTAPFTEELGKASGLILLLVLAPKLIRTAFDGLIIGAYLGLGFQIVEDMLYAVEGGAGDFGATPSVAPGRSASCASRSGSPRTGSTPPSSAPE